MSGLTDMNLKQGLAEKMFKKRSETPPHNEPPHILVAPGSMVPHANPERIKGHQYVPLSYEEKKFQFKTGKKRTSQSRRKKKQSRGQKTPKNSTTQQE